jgi:PAS domain S-box-containing protein
MFASALWSASNAFEMMGIDLPTKLFWANVQYICYNTIAVGWFVMALYYTGQGRWLTKRRLAMLLIVPAITVALAWTDQWHHLMRRGVHLDYSGPFPVIGKTFGPWFWIYSAYTYPLVLAACLIHIRAMLRMWSYYRWQTLMLVVAVILPYAANLAFAIGLSPLKFDVAPTLFSICGLFYSWGLFRFELFDRLPAARSMVIESMGDAVIVLDRRRTIVEFNPAALAIAGSAEELAGRTVSEVLGDELGACLESAPEGGQREVLLRAREASGSYEARWWPVRDNRSKAKGTLLLLHDVTGIRQARAEAERQQQLATTLEERSRLARELHDSLGQVMGYMNIRLQTILEELRAGRLALAESGIEELSQVAVEANTEIREFIYDIRSSLLLKDGFFKTLDGFARRFEAQFGIAVRVENPQGLGDSSIAPLAQTQLFRIIQEALANARKHSKSRNVVISLEKSEGEYRIGIADDGVGFDPEALPRESHYGLGIMRERARQLGGDLRVESAPGSGTTVAVSFPLHSQDGGPPPEPRPSPGGILLADDHALFLDGLSNVLAAKGFAVVGTARDGWEALEKARALRPELVLMDIQMPDCDGLAATRLISAEMPETKIVMLTMSDSADDLVEAVKSGASGYLLKGLGAEELVREVGAILEGDTSLSASLAARVLDEFGARPAAAEDSGLTPRQAEVLALVAQGWLYKEIAGKLGMSERTVKFHMRGIVDKLHLRNRAEVEAYARSLISVPRAIAPRP